MGYNLWGFTDCLGPLLPSVSTPSFSDLDKIPQSIGHGVWLPEYPPNGKIRSSVINEPWIMKSEGQKRARSILSLSWKIFWHVVFPLLLNNPHAKLIHLMSNHFFVAHCNISYLLYFVALHFTLHHFLLFATLTIMCFHLTKGVPSQVLLLKDPS